MKRLTRYAVLTPIIFAIITIFFTYNRLEIFLIGGAALIIAELVIWWKTTKSAPNFKQKLSLLLPLALILVGSIGISAASNLTREKMAINDDPSRVGACSISPIVACSPVINSDQASAFGVPNPLLGIFGYGALIVAGISLLAGRKFPRWWWLSLWAGTLFGFVFILWLIYQSLYIIGALCIYCMSVWVITIPLFYYTSYYNILNGHFKPSERYIDFIQKNHLILPVATITLIIGLIYLRFSDYWNTLF